MTSKGGHRGPFCSSSAVPTIFPNRAPCPLIIRELLTLACVGLWSRGLGTLGLKVWSVCV